MGGWECDYFDAFVSVKSWQAVEKYDMIKFFKESQGQLTSAELTLKTKQEVEKTLNKFLENNSYTTRPQYNRLVKQINQFINNARAYRVRVSYTSPAGKSSEEKELNIYPHDIKRLKNDPSLLMNKSEYNKFIREQQKKELDLKHKEYYDRINKLIDFANENRNYMVIANTQKRMEELVSQLYDKTVNSIQKIKSIDSEEWGIIGKFIRNIEQDMSQIVNENKRLLDYYKSPDLRV